MKEKILNLKENAKLKILGVSSCGAIAFLMPTIAHAETATPTAVTIDWSSMGKTVLDYFNGALSDLLPIGVIIFAAMLGISFGPKIIKKLAGR